MDEEGEQKVPYDGWLFLTPGAVPSKWQERAVPMSLVPLDPAEAAAILDPESGPRLAGLDLAVATHVARGRSAPQISRALEIAERTVYRRLERLRKEFHVSSTQELATKLSRMGF